MSTTALTTAGRSLVRRGRPNRPAVDNAFASSWCPYYGVRFIQPHRLDTYDHLTGERDDQADEQS